MAELARYLARIDHSDRPLPDLATLRALHRRHVEAIPFEALDAQTGRIPSMETGAIFGKLVEQRRGGWCYEMNGLFGWALEEIGFEVTRVSCGVMRHVAGEERMGTHLALLVQIDGRPWLADVGFGSSLAEPIPLANGEHPHTPFKVALSQDEGYWRYSEFSGGEPFSFDFLADPADEALLAAKCAWQATSPESNFVQNFVAMKREGGDHLALRGRVLTRRGPAGPATQTLSDADEFETVLRTVFGIEHPAARSLWPAIVARHDALFGAAAA